MGARFEWKVPTARSIDPPLYAKAGIGLHAIEQVGCKVYVIGSLYLGHRPREANSFAVLDLRTVEWRWVQLFGHAPRCFSHVTFLSDDGLYAFGGTTQWHDDSNELFRMDLTSSEWIRVETGRVKPKACKDLTGQFIERTRQFVCFGGYEGAVPHLDGYSSGVWALDTEWMSWRRPKVKGPVPLAHGQASCVVDTKIFAYGGKHVTGALHSLHVVDCAGDTLQFSQVAKCASYMGRVFASLSYVNGRLILWGGYNHDQQDCSDLFVFERPSFQSHPVSAGRYNKYSYKNKMSAMYGHCAFVRGKEVWIVGGFYNKNSLAVLQQMS